MFKYYIKIIVNNLYNLFISLKFKNIGLGYNCRVLFGTEIEGSNKFGNNCIVGGKIGRCTYIGYESNVIGEIGRYNSISAKVTLMSATHPAKDFVSTSPVFYSLRKQCGATYTIRQKFDEFGKNGISGFPIKIGNDVLISYGVTILGPVTVGDGAVIGAHALVTKDVEPYTIVGGIPAKVIGKRFSDEQIDKLLKLKWWEKDEKWIKSKVDLFEDIEIFLNDPEIIKEMNK